MSKEEINEPDSTSSSDNDSGGDDREHTPEEIYIPNDEPKQYYLAIRKEIEENGKILISSINTSCFCS